MGVRLAEVDVARAPTERGADVERDEQPPVLLLRLGAGELDEELPAVGPLVAVGLRPGDAGRRDREPERRFEVAVVD